MKGGSKFAAYLNRLANKLGRAQTLRVGFLEGARYPDGKPVAMIAAIQNFGAPKVGIPPRPFFTNMVKDKSPGWGNAIAANLVPHNYDAVATLNVVGEGIKGQLQESIVDTNTPALSPVTVMLRGMRANNPSLVVTGATVGEARRRVDAGLTNYGASTKPLIDSGYMSSRVGYEVKSK